MNLFLLLLTGVTIGITGAMIPGPLTLFTVSEVLKSNRYAGIKIIAGHIGLEILFIAAILLGLQRLLSSEGFLLAISAVGGLALIAMGVILIENVRKMGSLNKKADPGFTKGLFIGGIFFSVISPGFLAWWATIGVSTVISALLSGILGVAALTLGHWFGDIAWYWSLSYAIDKGKDYLSGKTYQNILRFFSTILIVLGMYFLTGVFRFR